MILALLLAAAGAAAYFFIFNPPSPAIAPAPAAPVQGPPAISPTAAPTSGSSLPTVTPPGSGYIPSNPGTANPPQNRISTQLNLIKNIKVILSGLTSGNYSVILKAIYSRSNIPNPLYILNRTNSDTFDTYEVKEVSLSEEPYLLTYQPRQVNQTVQEISLNFNKNAISSPNSDKVDLSQPDNSTLVIKIIK